MTPTSIPLHVSKLRRWRLPLISLGVALAVGATWAVASKTGGDKTAAEKKVAAGAAEKIAPIFELASVDISHVEGRELRVNLPISGSLLPLNQATVRSKVAAEVREVLVQEGMSVKKGQVIARFDGADLRARLTAQDAALDEAQAKLSLAQKNRRSNETLLKQNYISQNAFDTSNNSVELANASLKSAQAQREIAQLALADTIIKAPVDGIISKRNVQVGEKVSPDSPLVSIVDLAQLTLEAQVPASEIPRIKIGQEVSFRVDGFEQRVFSGKVARINPSAEAGSRSMTVYIAVENRDLSLKGGMFAKGNLTLKKNAELPTIPLNALRKQDGQDVVYAVVNNQVQEKKVKLGLRNEDEGFVQVLEGLDAGATVLSAKLEGVKVGSKVKLPEVPHAPSSLADTKTSSNKG